MSENTGYLLSRTGFEYNDEGYDITEGVRPQKVYWYFEEARKAARDAVAEMVRNDDEIGHYCYSMNYGRFNFMRKKFPGLFDVYGDFNVSLAESTGKIEELIAYIVENFDMVTVQEIDIVGLK